MEKTIITSQGLSRTIKFDNKPSIIHLIGKKAELLVNTKTEFSLFFNGHTYKSSEFGDTAIQDDNNQITICFHCNDMDVIVIYQVSTDNNYLKKWLEITFHRPGILEQVVVESFYIPEGAVAEVAKSTGNFDICLFLSLGNQGLFFTLDYPYNDIIKNDTYFEIAYPPYQHVKSGETIKSHVSTIGNYGISGRKQGIYDVGQAEAFRNYLLSDYAKPHLQAPQLVYSSIVNQYTEVNFNIPDTPKGRFPIQNKIFYTLTNAPYVMLYPERINNEIDFCKSLSMEFCQIYEGPFEWVENNPDETTLINISNYAKEEGIKLGLYTGANSLTAPHFNHYGEDKGKPEWHIVDANGNEANTYCFGSDEFTKWFTEVIINASQKYGFLMANFDFLTITPCYAKNHGHPPGGIYHQITNVWKCLKEIRSAIPGYVFDSNLGWDPIIPKIACQMDGFYISDPYVNTYFPSLNATKILDDSRRADMVRYFSNYLTPVEYFRNCEYYVCADSVIHDYAIFEYGILQGLAVTPNLQLGESLALFNRLNCEQCEHARKFIAKWTQFVKDNWEYYHYTKIITDLPTIGQVEVYAHCKSDRGYVFLVNPNPFRLAGKFELNETIGLSSGEFLIRELYPEENSFPAIGKLPYKEYGETIEYIVEAQKCVVLSIEPAFHDGKARLFGIFADLQRNLDSYEANISYYQGNNKQVFLQLPYNEEVISIYSDDQKIPFYKVNDLYSFSLSFPKQKVEPEIRQWVISEGSLNYGLEHNFHQGIDGVPIAINPSLSGMFLGAYIENLLNEKYSTSLKVLVKKTDKGRHKKNNNQFITNQNEPMSDNGKQIPKDFSGELWLSSRFGIPFIQKYIPPDYYHHNFIMLNFLKPSQIKSIKAWINGNEVSVNRYDYWRGSASDFTYYLDGTRSSLNSGNNTLVLWISV